MVSDVYHSVKDCQNFPKEITSSHYPSHLKPFSATNPLDFAAIDKAGRFPKLTEGN